MPESIRRADRDFVSSFDRGLRVLAAFDRSRPELTLSEVALKIGVPVGTARRFLLTLKSLGYVGMHGRRFVLRARVLSLARSYLDAMHIDDALRPYLDDMVRRTGDSTSVTVLDGPDIVYIASASAHHEPRLEAGLGSRSPAYDTAAGRVLLANLPPEKLNDYFASKNVRRITKFPETKEEEIRRHLLAIHTCGYSVLRDRQKVGVLSSAVPLHDSAGYVFAAISCASARRMVGKKILRARLHLMLDYAAQLSSALLSFPALARSVDRSPRSASLPAGIRVPSVGAPRH